ncbi:hypothetical protein B0O99DRAFT_633676 [Bisporella sp. PMI_857]|nr:hypothetical protein B0O99DRAFT_633676 [Bisporella sp. PMI_857]
MRPRAAVACLISDFLLGILDGAARGVDARYLRPWKAYGRERRAVVCCCCCCLHCHLTLISICTESCCIREHSEW